MFELLGKKECKKEPLSYNKLLCSGKYRLIPNTLIIQFFTVLDTMRISFQQNTETDSGSNTSLPKLKGISGHFEVL